MSYSMNSDFPLLIRLRARVFQRIEDRLFEFVPSSLLVGWLSARV